MIGMNVNEKMKAEKFYHALQEVLLHLSMRHLMMSRSVKRSKTSRTRDIEYLVKGPGSH